jgi:prevent-host-death family protein
VQWLAADADQTAVLSAQPEGSRTVDTRQTQHVRNSGDPNRWQIQDAKTSFSEVVRRATECGPQHVTVNGEEKAVVISAEEYVRLRGRPTGQELVNLLADSPLADLILDHPKAKGPVRVVDL